MRRVLLVALPLAAVSPAAAGAQPRAQAEVLMSENAEERRFQEPGA